MVMEWEARVKKEEEKDSSARLVCWLGKERNGRRDPDNLLCSRRSTWSHSSTSQLSMPQCDLTRLSRNLSIHPDFVLSIIGHANQRVQVVHHLRLCISSLDR
jgi:hypothetical protein